ncbi:MAG TPA: pyridoxamine 5'-phosphate oxidase family protein [Syntrophales bacterium]|nr:pyridoxamine 5'-phosphate oxidase family protein [Syntrophales bacterium]
MAAKLMEYFNKQPRIGTLSTADKEGKVNSAVLGSPRMVDEKTVVMTLRNSRTFANLLVNPYAVFSIMEPGKTTPEWKGIRVYLKMTGYQTSGEKLETMRAQAAQRIGEATAKLIHAAVTLEVYDVRPMIDSDQGWEAAI